MSEQKAREFWRKWTYGPDKEPAVASLAALLESVRAEERERADAERDTLRAEVERLKEMNAGHPTMCCGQCARQIREAKAEVERLRTDSLSSAPPYYRHWQEEKAKREKAEAALLSAEAKIRAWPSGRDFDPEDALRILRGPAPAVPGPDHGSPDPAAPVSRRDTACDGSDVGLGCDCGHAERHAPPEEKP